MLGERNFVYGNGEVILYVILSWLFFLLGFLSVSALQKFNHKAPQRIDSKTNVEPIISIAFMILILLLNVLVVVLTFLQLPTDYFVNAISGHGFGGQLRTEVPLLRSRVHLNWVSPVSFSVILFSFWVFLTNPHLKERRYRKFKFLFTSLFLLSSLSYIVASLQSLTRGNLVALTFSMIIIFLLKKHTSNNLSYALLFRFLFWAFIIFILIYISVDLIRAGFPTLTQSIIQLFLYFLSPYNRLASIMEGYLSLPSPGFGYYTMQFLWNIPFINHVLLGSSVSSFEIWANNFTVISESGLNGFYSWSTVFAYAFVDYKWLGLFWFYAYGFLSRLVWRRFLKKQVTGIILYPYLTLSYLYWGGGTPLVGSLDFIILIIFSFIINTCIKISGHIVIRRTRTNLL